MIRFTVHVDTNYLRRPWVVMLCFAFLSTWFVLANYGLRGFPIGGDAEVFWTDLPEKYARLAGVYWPGPGLGANGSEQLPVLFPLLWFGRLLLHLGIPAEGVWRIVYIAITFFALSGTYALVRVLLWARVSRDRLHVAATAGALLYGFNLWTIVASSQPMVDQTLTTAVLPWAAAAGAFAVRCGFFGGTALIAIAVALAGSGNPAHFAVLVLTMSAVTLAAGWDARRFFAACAVLVAGLALGVACCIWWLLPLPTIVGIGLHAESIQGLNQWVAWMSGRSTLLRLLKLDGNISFQDVPFKEWYASGFGSVLGYVPLALAVFGLARLRRRLSTAIFVIFLATLALAKGTQPPLGRLFILMAQKVPGFAIFRSPYDKWIIAPALMLSVLFAIGIIALGSDLARRSPLPRQLRWTAIPAAAGAFCVLLYAWPAFAGANVKVLPFNHTFVGFVPPSYRSVTQYIARLDPAARVVVFDAGLPPYPSFKWGYIGDDPLRTLSANPITTFGDVLDGFDHVDSASLAAAFRRLSVRFVVVHYDIENPELSPDPRRLERDGVMRLLVRLPRLALYELVQPPDPFVHVPHALFRAGAGPLAVAPATEATVGRPAFNANWSAVIDSGGRPADLVYALHASPLLGNAREMLPERAGNAYALVAAPGETVYYAPTAVFGRYTSAVACAALAQNLHGIWSPAWKVNGRTLPLADPPHCAPGRASRAPSVAATKILELGTFRKLQRMTLQALPLARRETVMAAELPLALRSPGDKEPRLPAQDAPYRLSVVQWTPIEAHGRIDPRDSYEFQMDYVAQGAVLVRYSDEIVTRDVEFAADGRRHTARFRIFPSRLDGGRFKVQVLLDHGTIAIYRTVLRDIGPNGSFFALRPAAVPNRGRIDGLRWHFPSGAEFQLSHCASCAIEAGVSGDGFWQLSPGKLVVAPILGMAQASGGFAAFSPGMAGWELAGKGTYPVTLRYVPALRFQRGLQLTLVALGALLLFAVAGFVWRRRPAKPELEIPRRASGFQVAVAILTLCVAPLCEAVPDGAAAVIGTILLALALAVIVCNVVFPRSAASPREAEK